MLIPAGLLIGGLGYWLVLDHLRAINFNEIAWPLIALPIGKIIRR